VMMMKKRKNERTISATTTKFIMIMITSPPPAFPSAHTLSPSPHFTDTLHLPPYCHCLYRNLYILSCCFKGKSWVGSKPAQSHADCLLIEISRSHFHHVVRPIASFSSPTHITYCSHSDPIQWALTFPPSSVKHSFCFQK